jgi:hypothetical protein
MQPQDPTNTNLPNNPPPPKAETPPPGSPAPDALPSPEITPHAVGDVISPDASSQAQASVGAPVQNQSPTNASDSATPELFVSGSTIEHAEVSKKRNFKPSKKLVLIAAVPLLLLGGSAAAYFGYYVPNKPANVWASALTNTGKGYDKITTYATAKKDVKSMNADGSFKLSGSVASDGTFKGVSDGKNGELSGNISAAGLKVNYDVRAIDSPGNSPDVYFKVDGIQGLGNLVGGYASLLGADEASLTKTLNGVNGQWYFVDHTLFDQLTSSTNANAQITSADVSAALKAVGDSSKQYLFTNNPDNMAIVVKQYVGKEKQDGRSVYHYKVGVNKANLSAYNKSLCDNLIKSKLFKLFETGSNGDQDLTKQCYDTTGIDKINDNQTADAWVDLHTKLIHKIRLSDSKNKNNYVDIAQDYQGGDEFPFSIGFQTLDSVDSGIHTNSTSTSKANKSSGQINMKLNMKTNTFSTEAKFASSGETSDNAIFKLTVAPTNNQVKVEKPASSKTIIELLNDLGLGSLASDVSSSSGDIQAKSRDTKRQTDINAQRSQLEVYYADSGGYPQFSGQVNTDSWIKANLKGADLNAFRAPNTTANSMVNSASPDKNHYGYLALQNDGKTVCAKAPCAHYKLYWSSEQDGKVHEEDSLN